MNSLFGKSNKDESEKIRENEVFPFLSGHKEKVLKQKEEDRHYKCKHLVNTFTNMLMDKNNSTGNYITNKLQNFDYSSSCEMIRIDSFSSFSEKDRLFLRSLAPCEKELNQISDFATFEVGDFLRIYPFNSKKEKKDSL